MARARNVKRLSTGSTSTASQGSHSQKQRRVENPTRDDVSVCMKFLMSVVVFSLTYGNCCFVVVFF